MTKSPPSRATRRSNGGGYVGTIGVRRASAAAVMRRRCCYRTFAEFWRRGLRAGHARRRRPQSDRRFAAVRNRWDARRGARTSFTRRRSRELLRARCPDCRTLTAVAVDDRYECHSCGRTWGAGLVRVARAWGDGGEPMVEAAALPLDFPRSRSSRRRRSRCRRSPSRPTCPRVPLVLGGCCCSHIGAVEGLAARFGRLGGDLARRARRPQHAGDLAVRQRVGDAAADDHRPRDGQRGGRRRSGARGTSTRPRPSSSPRAGSRTIPRRARARRCRLRRARPRRPRAG